MRVLSLTLLFMVILTGAASAEKRYGLIIGNDAYAEVPKLELARSDARAVSAKLATQGFETVMLLDGTRREMNRRITEFTSRLQPGDTAFIFYAGHGVEIDGENYLLPTDIPAPASGERDFIKSESIALSVLLDRVRSTGARTTIAVIDACRDNPFATATGRSIGRTRGLGRIAAPEGMFVIFSAGAGQTALDRLGGEDTGTNSVFTRKLLPLLGTPDLELRPLMARLRVEVRDLAKTVNHNQMPAYYDELLGQFYFAAAPAPEADSGDAATQPAPAEDPIRADFALARSVGTAEALDAFLNRYANREEAFSVQLARQMREKLRTEAGAPESDASAEMARSSGEPQPTAPQLTQDAPAAPETDSEPQQIAAAEPAQEAPAASSATQPRATKREILRQTQQHLNALGCNAGAPDGIMGRRTRAAFDRYLAASGNRLGRDALGSQAALDAVTAPGAAKCPDTVATTAPTTGQAQDSAQDTASGGPDTPALTLAGTWYFTAKCALFVQSKGTVRFTHAGGNRYRGTISDNLGNVGRTDTYLNGRSISSTDTFPNIVVKFSGRLAADGRSYSGTGTNTCTVYASKG